MSGSSGLRLGAIASAAGWLAWAWMSPVWRGEAGTPAAAVCLPLAGAAASLLIAAAARTSLERAALWLGVALVGQAASLQLIDAGPILHYQHYRPLTELVTVAPFPLAVVALEAVMVAAGLVFELRGRWSQGRHATGWRVAAAVLLTAVTAATVSPDVRRYLAELVFAAAIQIVAMGALALVALALPRASLETASLRMSAWLDRPWRGRRDTFAWAAAAIAVVLSALLNLVSYERYPHVPDEVVYLHHARYFAEGMLTMPPPPVEGAFDVDLMTYRPDSWFSPVPPGWPAVLALGAAVGLPWLVNPLLGGVCVLLTGMLVERMYSPRIARLAMGLLALSPWFLFMAMSYMTHTLMLAAALLAAVGVARAREGSPFWWGIAAGCGVGIVSLIRPLEGVLIGVLIAGWAIGLGGRRLSLAGLAGLGVATVAVGALVFPYNAALTGDPLTFPINDYVNALYGPNANAYGFGPDRGLGWAFDPNPGHSPFDALVNANLNTFGINTDLFGWSTGSLLFVALFFTAGRWSRSDRSMLAVVAVVFTGYFFYYFSGGPDFAARYWFPIIVPLVVFTVRGLDALAARVGPGVYAAAGTLVLMSLATFVPWRAADRYHHYRGMRPDLRAIAAEHGFGGDLVLVKGRRFPDYASAFVLNPIDLRGSATVYAWDRDPEVRARTVEAYKDRRVWLVDGPSVTGSGFRVQAGPFLPGEVPAGGEHP